MTSFYQLCVLLLCYFPLLLLAQSGTKQKYYGNCPLYSNCGNFSGFYIPFSNTSSSECGLHIRGCDNSSRKAEVELEDRRWYEIESIYRNNKSNSIIVQDNELQKHLPKKCSDFDNDILPFPRLPLSSEKIFHIVNSMILYRCKHPSNITSESFSRYTDCTNYDIYYSFQPVDEKYEEFSTHSCSNFQVLFDPDPKSQHSNNPFKFLTAKLQVQLNFPEECVDCYETAGICLDGGESYNCNKAAAEDKHKSWKMVIVGSIIGGAFIIIIIIALLFYKRRHPSSSFKYQSRNIDGDLDSNGDLECSRIFFGIPVFSYKELEEATNNFDCTRELGEGGFGTVYYGKLQDGREVAVKRLYEHNYRRVQQFMTEIQILTRLRHTNLVTLYGCTSRHSRELLLVYEFIPNGTVACHLHGDLAKPGSLPWSVRMKIAIETASALAYLHATDIIHRDVKTNNILLDNHFCVKVADFGLSRLFPNDVTHVSTAPQGTPSYLDPEYYQCYQLTNKSDVYSFGVVLLELISSMPAVDVTRSRNEINLAILAVRKIQNSVLSELIDPSLGFESDNEVKRMIVSVAELAFQCLQLDRDTRPAMDQVLRMLERIEKGTDEQEHLEEEDLHEIRISSNAHPPPSLSPENDGIGSLKNLKPPRFHQTL
ncbi:hypothetical protein L6164_026837 [Bauhinia variegata]|uniref:Uncharacterized protein n=1 Tax=Bauhinia variegata TaxID=167791 RepID=A0ACB9LRD2_BAUVA|nr:hypothetical protein L6164_026837 [Bauhinia variegata]